jgi:F-type H+-transporting ATPase subunit gamma
MPSLKDLRIRINSVKATQKITSAMKMVAASKLRKEQERVEASRAYAARLSSVVATMSGRMTQTRDLAPELLVGRQEKSSCHLFVIVSSDRGLCGGFNTALARTLKAQLDKMIAQNQDFKIYCVGKKGRDLLTREYGTHIFKTIDLVGLKRFDFRDIEPMADEVISLFKQGEVDSCSVVFSLFESVISQVPTTQSLIPFESRHGEATGESETGALYIYEPDREAMLQQTLVHNITTQLYIAVLESRASVHGARMSAMDNASRNAGEMIDNLSLKYNRMRQACITRELIEIISGAEAV